MSVFDLIITYSYLINLFKNVIIDSSDWLGSWVQVQILIFVIYLIQGLSLVCCLMSVRVKLWLYHNDQTLTKLT